MNIKQLRSQIQISRAELDKVCFILYGKEFFVSDQDYEQVYAELQRAVNEWGPKMKQMRKDFYELKAKMEVWESKEIE